MGKDLKGGLATKRMAWGRDHGAGEYGGGMGRGVAGNRAKRAVAVGQAGGGYGPGRETLARLCGDICRGQAIWDSVVQIKAPPRFPKAALL